MKQVARPNIDCQTTLTTACSSFLYHWTVTAVSAAILLFDMGARHVCTTRGMLTGKEDGAEDGFGEAQEESHGEDGRDGVCKGHAEEECRPDEHGDTKELAQGQSSGELIDLSVSSSSCPRCGAGDEGERPLEHFDRSRYGARP